MNRSELIERMATGFPALTRKDAQVAVDHLFDAMTQALVDGRRVEIRGFGSFSVHRRLPRLARNPKTGERVAVPEKWVPCFKAGKELAEGVRKLD